MRNIKCISGHPLWLVRVKDTDKVIYENEDEEVTAFKCKKCGDIITAKVSCRKIKSKIQ